MSDTPPTANPAARAPKWRVPGLIDRLRRQPPPEENLDADDARTAGLVAIDRYRRPAR